MALGSAWEALKAGSERARRISGRLRLSLYGRLVSRLCMVATPYEGLRSNPGSFAMLLATDARGLELKSGQFDVESDSVSDLQRRCGVERPL